MCICSGKRSGRINLKNGVDMKFAIISLMLLTSSAFANEEIFRCSQLVNGNNNGKAYNTIKSLDVEISVDVEKKDAELKGMMLAKREYSERSESLYSYFTDHRKVKQKGEIVTVSAHDSNIYFCVFGSKCRSWDNLTLNVKTGEALFEQTFSMKMLGQIKTENSVKFNCSKI
jgi:hypothetical protein